ncbi:hypothetical protein HBB16_11210 [Pseudonocardia sp. MCCB 268]|nr:hypothetical protein [Pseudonocardia cytotoxica]
MVVTASAATSAVVQRPADRHLRPPAPWNRDDRRTRASIDALLDLAPETATLVEDGGERRNPGGQLVAGQTVVVRPGERGSRRQPGAQAACPGRGRADQGAGAGPAGGGRRRPGRDRPAAPACCGCGCCATPRGHRRGRCQIERAADQNQRCIERSSSATPRSSWPPPWRCWRCLLFGRRSRRRPFPRDQIFMIVTSPSAIVLATMPPLLAAPLQAARDLVGTSPCSRRSPRSTQSSWFHLRPPQVVD